MKDAFGTPQSLLILGGTSEIALATARRLVARRTRTVSACVDALAGARQCVRRSCASWR